MTQNTKKGKNTKNPNATILYKIGNLHVYLSQNWGADGHFEGLNVSKSQLDQKLQHKSQMLLTTVFFNFGRKKS